MSKTLVQFLHNKNIGHHTQRSFHVATSTWIAKRCQCDEPCLLAAPCADTLSIVAVGVPDIAHLRPCAAVPAPPALRHDKVYIEGLGHACRSDRKTFP